MRLELIEGKLSRSVPRGLGGSNPTWLLGTGRKGSKDLARGLPYLRSRFRQRLMPSGRLRQEKQDKESRKTTAFTLESRWKRQDIMHA